MPKETIHCTSGRTVGLEVRWVRDRTDVQIVTRDVVAAPDTPDDGVFVSLDRAGINRLIRSLRKARDQAFGADA